MRSSERLYTTLLFRASRKYASWDPEIPMEVGDYGIITSGGQKRGWRTLWRKRPAVQRGIFLKEGNIYTDGYAEKWNVPLPKEYGADADDNGKDVHDGVTWITSKNAKEVSIEVAAGGQTPVFADCKLKAAYQFSSDSGAVLAMQNDTISTLQPPARLRFLYDEPELLNKVIVSEVHRCSSYARFVSTSKLSSVAIGLSVQSPEGTGGLVGDVESGAESRWVKSVSSGNFKTRNRNDGKRLFYPLFRLVALDEKGLAGGLRGEKDGGDPPLPDVMPPWLETEQGGEESES